MRNEFSVKSRPKTRIARAAAAVVIGLQLSGCGATLPSESLTQSTPHIENIDDELENLVFTNARYIAHEELIVILRGQGGPVEPIINQYEAWARENRQIVVHGQVASADAFGAFSEAVAGNTCYTEAAVFSPHAASLVTMTGSGDIIDTTVDTITTDRLATNLMDPLETAFTESPFYTDYIGYAYIDSTQLRNLWPEGQCDAAVMERVNSIPALRP